MLTLLKPKTEQIRNIFSEAAEHPLRTCRTEAPVRVIRHFAFLYKSLLD